MNREPLARDLHCVHCRYLLRGLDPTALCPECAAPIADSLHAARPFHEHPADIRRLARGLDLVFWGNAIAVAGLFPLLLFPAAPPGAVIIAAAVIVPGLAIAAWGWWTITRRGIPTRTGGGEPVLTLAASVALIGAALAYAASALLPNLDLTAIGPFAGITLGILLLITGVVALLVGVFSRFAILDDIDRLVYPLRTETARFGIFLGTILVLTLWPVGVMWYLVLVIRLRSALRLAMRHAGMSPDGPST